MKRSIQIQTTSICNARCKICPYATSFLAKNKACMDDTVFGKVVFRIKEANIEISKLCMYLQNEPLTDPSLFDRINVIKKTFGRIPLELSTNCALLDPARAETLITCAKDVQFNMHLSFHGTNKKEHEDMMGISYDTALANIKTYLSLSDRTSITNRIVSVCVDKKKAQLFWKSIFEELSLTRHPSLRLLENNNRAGNLSGEYAYSFVRERAPYLTCRRLRNWIHVNWRGEVIICCNDYENEVILGNLLTTPLQKIIKDIPKTIDAAIKKYGKSFICNRCDMKAV